ncbi:hypothetical protein OH809_29285 [Streptomyces sp. NBC_00873]|uniref:hypothetical protein n=1 Tax=Streptomyces sp. NBC_00873 TaxID=2975852 RepID=UPI003868581A|nr:hypothetical protein OH809_29285 [Streptomyces sp. NBC_00873]
MKLYLVIPVVLVALLFAASGAAGITRGWVLPTNRRPVRRPRLYGWGQLVAAFALCWQMVFFSVISDIDIRQWGTLFGSALLLTGLILMGMSQRPGGNRQGSATP